MLRLAKSVPETLVDLSQLAPHLRHGLVAAFVVDGSRVVDLISGDVGTDANVTHARGVAGIEAQYLASSSAETTFTGGAVSAVPDEGPFTVIAFTGGGGLSGDYQTLFSKGDTDNAGGWALRWEQWENSAKLGLTKFGVTDITSTLSTPTDPAGVGLTVSDGQTPVFFLNGVIDDSSTNTSAFNTFAIDNVVLAAEKKNLTTVSYADVNIQIVLVWNYAKSVDEVARITADRHSIYSRAFLPINAAAAGGGSEAATGIQNLNYQFAPFAASNLNGGLQ